MADLGAWRGCGTAPVPVFAPVVDGEPNGLCSLLVCFGLLPSVLSEDISSPVDDAELRPSK